MSDTAPSPILEISDLRHAYGDNQALDGLSFSVGQAEIFGLLGPNGGGKTTLFRILATLMEADAGNARVAGHDLRTAGEAVRRAIGVVFQAPSLDVQLTVRENLRHQGHLYGLSGAELESRIDEMLERVRLREQAKEFVQTLSGGMKRRVDLAKGLLHRPALVLLDEPTTGLDPGARLDLWSYLEQARREDGLSILITTHLMEDADRCDRLLFLDRGRSVAEGTPDALRSEIGGDVVTVHSPDLEALANDVRARFEFEEGTEIVDGSLRISIEDGPAFVPALFDAFPGRIEAVSVGKPTLEDVFIQRTGHRLWTAQ